MNMNREDRKEGAGRLGKESYVIYQSNTSSEKTERRERRLIREALRSAKSVRDA